MSHYNKLAKVVYNNRLTAWRFKVKILRIHSTLASYVESNQRNWSYIIADEDGTKTKMKIYAPSEERYRGLEKQEGNWVEIFLVEVDRAYPCFKATNSPFVLTVTPLTGIRLIDPLNNPYCDHNDLWLETEGGLSDFRSNPDMPEVEEFRQFLLNIDPYVQRHETIRPF
ncbi:hypothetical protein Bca4012_037856 [Brassica carinata]